MYTLKKCGNNILVTKLDYFIPINTRASNIVVDFRMQSTVNTTVTVNWGDGSSNTYSLTGTLTVFTHTYVNPGIYFTKISGNLDKILQFQHTNGRAFGIIGNQLYKMTSLRYFSMISFTGQNITSLGSGKLSLYRISVGGLPSTTPMKISDYLSRTNVEVVQIGSTNIVADDLTFILTPSLTSLMIWQWSKTNGITLDFTGYESTTLTSLIFGLNAPYSGLDKFGTLNLGKLPNITGALILCGFKKNAGCRILIGGFDFSKITSNNMSFQNTDCMEGDLTPVRLSSVQLGLFIGTNTGLYGSLNNIFDSKGWNISNGQWIITENKNITGDLTNLRFNRNAVWGTYDFFNMINLSLTGDISNLLLPINPITVNLSANLLVGINNFLSGVFTDRLNRIYTSNTAISVNNNTEIASGTYGQGPITPYTGSVHDLTEAQITEVSANWSTRQKVWWLVNGQISSTNTTKRYKYTITL